MAGIFISHRAGSASIVKDFAGEFIVRECGIKPEHIFMTLPGTEVPGGSMMYSRVIRALLDAPVIIIWGEPQYFQSSNCVIEFGASLSAKGKVFYLLSPETSWESVPAEFSWVCWRYAHDREVMNEIRVMLENSEYIDRAPHLRIEGYCRWPSSASDKSANNLNEFRKSWPRLIHSRPIEHDSGKTGAVFGLLVWRLEDGRSIPVVYADDDQMSVMNADQLVEDLKSKYGVDEIYALWPDLDMGVCAHSGRGGTRRHVEQELRDMRIPLPQIEPSSASNREQSYLMPEWYAEWDEDHPNGTASTPIKQPRNRLSS